MSCTHHWHLTYLSKHSRAITCCHCGERWGTFELANRPSTCGRRVYGAAPPVDASPLVLCEACEGEGFETDAWCAACNGEGVVPQ